MNCIEFEELLEQCVEHRTAPDPSDVQTHTHHCAECAGRWERFLLLESAVKVWNREVPEVDFTTVLLEKLTAETLHDQPAAAPRIVTSVAPRGFFRQQLRRLAPLLVPAALVALLFFLKPAPTDEPLPPLVPITQTDPPPVSAPETPQPSPGQPAPAVPQTDRLVKHAEQAYWQLGNELASVAGDFSVLLPTADPPADTPAENSLPAEPAPWMDRLGNELNPLPGDVGRAFRFLKDAVPNSSSAPL